MEITKMIKDYPAESLIVIGAFFSAIGYIGSQIIQYFVDRNKQKKELKTFLWKEKINAAKKASEYYIEYLNFINLLRNQLDMLASGKDEYEKVCKDIDSEIQEMSAKLKSFPHFEHHHINIFYNLTENRAFIITQENFEILGKITGLGTAGLSKEEFETQIKECIIKFKDNYTELANINQGFLEQVRNDINDYL